MVAPWPSLLFLLLVSPAVGSFLGVLVERLPRGQSILGPSRCADCGTRLAWRHMIPITSAVALGQRCATCGAAIPAHLIRIEIAAVGATFVAFLAAETALHLYALVLCVWCLVALFYTDLTVMRLPDVLTATLFAVALAAAWAAPDRTVIEAALTGVIAALILALLRWGYQRLRGVEGMGLGDVKLIAGLGALLGWQDLPLAALLAALLALAVALLDHLRGQQSWSTSTAVPFGSYLIGATLLLLIL